MKNGGFQAINARSKEEEDTSPLLGFSPPFSIASAITEK